MKSKDLRAKLFETIEAVSDGSMDVKDAKAIASLSSEINKSATVELTKIRLEMNMGAKSQNFGEMKLS